jgi:multiple sugar transport system ATP-binding protein
VSGIVLESVRKEFADGVVAVNDLDLEIKDGEFVALVGPSGCGKTTTLRMVAGLEEITSGQIRINDRVVTGMPPRHRDIAMVFQNYALYAHMTVRRNMGFGLKMAGMPKDEIKRRVDNAASMLGVTKLLDRKPKQLSGGERQRVAMGRAIVREPAAFLMDEPLSNLDAKLRVEMRSEIVNVQRRLGTPTMYVTHDQVEAMTMGDRVAILRLGELQQLGTPEEVYEKPVNVFVATFIGSPAMNLFPGQLHNDNGQCNVSIGGSQIPVPEAVLRRSPTLHARPSQPVVVGIRPEDFSSPEHSRSSGHSQLDVKVVRAESLGSELIVYFERPNGSPANEGETVTTSPVVTEATDQVADATGQVAEATPRLLTARLERTASVRDAGPARLAVDLDRLYFFDAKTGEAIGH